MQQIKDLLKKLKNADEKKQIKLLLDFKKSNSSNPSKSENKFYSMFEKHDAIMLLIEPKSGDIIEANNSATAFYGYSKDELTNMKIDDINILNPEEVYKYREQALAQEVNSFNFQHRLKDNTLREVQVHSTPIKYLNQDLLFSIIFDITEQKRSQDELDKIKSLLVETESLSKVGGWEYDVISENMIWTDEVYKIYGVDRQNFDPNNISQDLSFYHEEDRKILEQHFQDAVQKGEDYDLVLRFKPANKEPKWIRTIGKTQRKKGKIVKITGHIMDITQSKIAEEKIIASENRYRNLLETAGSIIVTMDRNALLTDFNESAEKITGYKKDEVLGKNWFDIFIPSEDHKAIMEIFRNTLDTIPEAFIHDNEILLKDGSRRIISWNNNVIRDNAGEVIGALSIGRDVTDINKARDELKQYGQTQKILLSEVNHRVKNNLTALISILHKTHEQADEKGLNIAAVLPVMEERINGLLNVHSMLSEIGWQSLKLSDLCTSIVSGTLEGMTTTNRVKLNVKKSDVMISSDKAHQLTIVLNELAINSLKYGFKNSDMLKINIAITEKNNMLTLKYSDNGNGYPKKLLKGDLSDIAVGFDLLRGIVEQSLNGKLKIKNDAGAVTIIAFDNS